MKRYGMMVKVKPEKSEEYIRLHAAVWPKVLDMIKQCNIQNYSIYHRDDLLFSYFEYTGEDFDADMKKMAADPTTQEWWAVCTPCFDAPDSAEEKKWWIEMEEIFHLD
ncbi:MAG: L-rhamnose mutarotase [bacterium]